MGDREQFNMMPSLEPLDKTTPSLRALPFIHENEIARPDYYSVTFDNGIKTEIAPASHSAIFQTTFTTDTGSIIFDSKDGNVEDFDFDATNNVLTCYVDNASGLSEGASKMYIYVQFSNQTVQDVDQSSGINYVKFDTSSNKVVQAKIATSYMSNEQAEKNLKLEILDDKLSFDDLHQRATNK
jgi:putative alpha-1,2-mannosidase